MKKLGSKKSIITSGIIGIIIIIIAITQFVYGNDFNKGQIAQSGFFTTDKTDVEQNSYVTMTIDLSSINYENFKFTLTADSNLEGNVSENTDNSSNTDAIQANADGNTITITAKKSQISLGKINLYYKVPTSLSIGSTITLTAKIESLDQVQSNTNSTNEIVNNSEIDTNTAKSNVTISNTSANEVTSNSISNTTNSNTSELYKVATVKLTVVKAEANSTGNNATQQNQSQPNNIQIIQNNSFNTTEQKTTGTNYSSSYSESKGTTTTSETYKGSYINYLTDISIDGYSITPEFSMTNTTYMLEVENDVTSIDISTTKYDSSSIVKIYGNTNLEVGENKVLISVTAENGSVRTYRIYVTRKAE